MCAFSDVWLAEYPECTGVTTLYEGDPMSLTCSMKFWGSQIPDLEWAAGSEIVKHVEDRTQVDQSVMAVVGDATWQDDKLPYQCTGTQIDITDQCELTMNVICE